MAKKQPPKPLFSLKADFYESLDNVAQQGIMLITAIETVMHHTEIPKGVKELLVERVKAFRSALSSDD